MLISKANARDCRLGRDSGGAKRWNGNGAAAAATRARGRDGISNGGDNKPISHSTAAALGHRGEAATRRTRSGGDEDEQRRRRGGAAAARGR